MKKKCFSIYFVLGTIFVLIVIITSATIGTILFVNMRKAMRNDLATRLHDVASIGVGKIDADIHATLSKPEQESSIAYKKIKKTLQEIRDSGTDIRYVYTMRRISAKNYVFVVDAEEDPKNISHLGDLYEDDDIEPAFNKTNKVWVNREFSTDKWGTWMSGYAQIYTKSGKFDGIIGIDIAAKIILEREKKVLFNIIFVVIVVIFIFASVGVIISKKIAEPLTLLEKDMSQIKELNMDTNIEIKTRFKEIISMKNVEDSMKIALRSFKKYVPSDLVTRLIRLNKEAVLGGERKNLTIFFSDIADFTNISEKIASDQVANYMKEYFAGVTNIIMKHMGTVDKYIGDAVMAFWGAPSDITDHAYKASLAALECQEFLLKMNNNLEKAGNPVLNTRIGINTGEVIVGNFGYEERFDYTVFGDNVNIASRIEDLNKIYGTKIIISESTYKLVKDRIVTRKIDIVSVKGKNICIPIYELVCLNSSLSEEKKYFLDLFNQGMELYIHKEWNEAIISLEKAKKLDPNDKPTKIIIERCKDFIINPSSDNWQKIVVLREK
ncbi:MAG: adenylate/guanylate cyclase domain-containing protein [Elusimicrobiota bacterium]